MKYKQKIDLYIALIFVLIGVIVITLPLFNVNNIRYILVVVFSLYAVINLVQFLLTKESKDYEGVQTFIASLVTLILCTLLDNSKPSNLSMIIMTWTLLNSLIRLKKMDYYHDRRDRMWKIQLMFLVLFIISGLLVSINLAYSKETQVLVIGFFMFINGILDLFDPIVKSLISHK